MSSQGRSAIMALISIYKRLAKKGEDSGLWKAIRYCACFVLFFFSSRRRHTRFDCDWSSDVCSSDLNAPQHVDGVDPLGGANRPGKCAAIGSHCDMISNCARPMKFAPLYDNRISSSLRPSVLSSFFTALDAAISPWLA